MYTCIYYSFCYNLVNWFVNRWLCWTKRWSIFMYVCASKVLDLSHTHTYMVICIECVGASIPCRRSVITWVLPCGRLREWPCARGYVCVRRNPRDQTVPYPCHLELVHLVTSAKPINCDLCAPIWRPWSRPRHQPASYCNTERERDADISASPHLNDEYVCWTFFTKLTVSYKTLIEHD